MQRADQRKAVCIVRTVSIYLMIIYVYYSDRGSNNCDKPGLTIRISVMNFDTTNNSCHCNWNFIMYRDKRTTLIGISRVKQSLIFKKAILHFLAFVVFYRHCYLTLRLAHSSDLPQNHHQYSFGRYCC